MNKKTLKATFLALTITTACQTPMQAELYTLVLNQNDIESVKKTDCEFIGKITLTQAPNYYSQSRTSAINHLTLKVRKMGGNLLLTSFENTKYETPKGEAYNCPAKAINSLKELEWIY